MTEDSNQKLPPVHVEYSGVSAIYQPLSHLYLRDYSIDKFFEGRIINFVLENCLEKTDVVLDIGANTGLWTIPIAKTVTSGRVFCIEPEENSMRELVHNININAIANAKPLRLALSSRNGRANFYIREDPELASLFEVNPLSEKKNLAVTRVKTQTLDNLIETGLIDPPNFLKIDAEGAEILILKGLSKKRVGGIRYILIEVHDSCLELQGISDPRRCLEKALNELGFRGISYLDKTHLLASH